MTKRDRFVLAFVNLLNTRPSTRVYRVCFSFCAVKDGARYVKALRVLLDAEGNGAQCDVFEEAVEAEQCDPEKLATELFGVLVRDLKRQASRARHH